MSVSTSDGQTVFVAPSGQSDQVPCVAEGEDQGVPAVFVSHVFLSGLLTALA